MKPKTLLASNGNGIARAESDLNGAWTVYLYAGLRNGDIWQTTDYGNTWEKPPVNLNGIWFLLVVM